MEVVMQTPAPISAVRCRNFLLEIASTMIAPHKGMSSTTPMLVIAVGVEDSSSRNETRNAISTSVEATVQKIQIERQLYATLELEAMAK
jgi:hypothetical protein